MRISFVLPALLVALATACGSASRIVITESRTTKPGPFERIAVYVSLPSGGGDRGIYHGVKKVMPRRLAACDVGATVEPGMPPTPEEAAAAPPSPVPEAHLIIRSRYGRLNTTTTVDQFGNKRDERAFKSLELDLWFELFDYKLQRVTWQAFANVKLEDNMGNLAGEKLANMIADRLRSDGVLVRCR